MQDPTQIKKNTPLQNLNENTPGPLNEKESIRRLTDLIEVVTVAPAGYPKKFWDSIKIHNDSGTYYLYAYVMGVGWKKVTIA